MGSASDSFYREQAVLQLVNGTFKLKRYPNEVNVVLTHSSPLMRLSPRFHVKTADYSDLFVLYWFIFILFSIS